MKDLDSSVSKEPVSGDLVTATSKRFLVNNATKPLVHEGILVEKKSNHSYQLGVPQEWVHQGLVWVIMDFQGVLWNCPNDLWNVDFFSFKSQKS